MNWETLDSSRANTYGVMFLTLVTLTLCRCLKQIFIPWRQTSTEGPLHPYANNSNVIPSQ
jgi:hypothetical protein